MIGQVNNSRLILHNDWMKECSEHLFSSVIELKAKGPSLIELCTAIAFIDEVNT